MGFDLVGQAATKPQGEYFRNNVWWWRPLHALIYLTASDILTEEEMDELGYNDGFAFSPDKAQALAKRLSNVVSDEKFLAECEKTVMIQLPGYYHGCWSKENILEFIEFLEHSGGFTVN